MRLRHLTVAPFILSVLVACGTSAGPAGVLPHTAERESGQSGLMDKTFAGAKRCDPKSQDRPFIIEWDATDMSSFEAKASNDVVFVAYEGCNLRVLDGCSDESLKGALGSYGAVDWTSGSLEKIDIANEGDLYAKLPLGVASLGARVEGGEQFHMEYYVSGMRSATRPAVYRSDLDKIPACKGATHFVSSYNLGAFALGSAKQMQVSAGATVWGIGAGGSQKSLNSAEKKGGVLTSCSGETAHESQSCKVPIRLTLREITAGDNPEIAERAAPETPGARSLAAKVDERLNQKDKAGGYFEAARDKFNARDGKGCLAELDRHDRADARAATLSTNPKAPLAYFRANCIMMAGQCDAGKALLRRVYQGQGQNQSPEGIDRLVDVEAARNCQGSSMSPRDQLLKADSNLSTGANTTKDPAFCRESYETLKRLSPTVRPNNDDDTSVQRALNPDIQSRSASACFARAGDCASAFELFASRKKSVAPAATLNAFQLVTPKCKSWSPGAPH